MSSNHNASRLTPTTLTQQIDTMHALNLTVERMKAFVLSVTKEATIEQQTAECNRYGTFMGHLSRSGMEAMFWVPFATVFVLLVLAATSHQKSERTYMHGKHHPEEAAEKKLQQRRWRTAALLFTTFAAILVVACVIFEALAGCALTYCLKHKLIWFYWGMWTLTQVGSLIAIIGVTVHQWACLGEHSTPPWNVALGTPILVITGIAHIIGSWSAKKLREWTASEVVSSARSTYNPDTQAQPLLVAYKLDGGVIMEYPSECENRKAVPGEKILGNNEYGGYIIEYPPPAISTIPDLLAKIVTPRTQSSDVTSNTTFAPLPSPP